MEWQESNNEDIDETLQNCFDAVDLPYESSMIDRAHIIGAPYDDKESGRKVKSIIVKFSSWSARTRFHKARPKTFLNGKKKPGQVPFKVSLDLTNRRYQLLKHARDVVKGNHNVSYVFTDINCTLVVESANNKFYNFNSEAELNDIIVKL